MDNRPWFVWEPKQIGEVPFIDRYTFFQAKDISDAKTKLGIGKGKPPRRGKLHRLELEEEFP